MSSDHPPEPAGQGTADDAAGLRAALRAWILSKNEDLDPQALSDQTPLLASRYLRSVHLPELILLLERLRGSPIDIEDLGAGEFRDIDTIVAGFVSPAQHPETAR